MSNVPKLRFPGYTGDWEQCKLGEITSVVPFKPYLKEAGEEGDYEVIQQGDKPVLGYADGEPFVDFENVTLFGDHTLSLYKPKSPFFVATDGLKILYSDGIEGGFYYYLLEKYKPDSEGYKRHFSILKECECCFPNNKGEQRAIGGLFSNLDKTITLHQRELSNLETQKKAVMRKIFSQEVRFKRADGSEFPEWEEAVLNNISERIIVGLATTVTPYYREKGVPMFRNLNIRAGYLDDSNILYLDEEYASKQGGKYIHAGDILTVHTGNIGWSCVVPDCYEGALSFTTLITTLSSNSATSDYICAYLNSDLGMKQMQDLAFSGGRANLNTSEFQKVIVPIPSLEEQQLIADFLSDFDEAIAAAKKELELWKELKKGLLQQMFV